MLRSIFIFVAGGVIGTAVGLAAGLFVYPYLFLADIVLSEQVRPGRRSGSWLPRAASFTSIRPIPSTTARVR